MIKLRIKIRGIYATALSKFLKDKGYEIVNLSDEMKKRINGDNGNIDTVISDKEDKNGVIISGEHSNEISELLKNNFDGITNKYSIGDIYIGKITGVNQRDGTISIDIGSRNGILNLSDYFGFTKNGEKVLVQIKHNSKIPILTTKLRIFGDNAVIIKGGYNNVSKYISNGEERERLINLKRIEGWGILWKSTAEGKGSEELIKEINKLIEKKEKIKKIFETKDESGKIFSGMEYYVVDFGGEAKLKLDEIRNKVTRTIEGHHILKSGGFSLLVDFAEKINLDTTKALKEVIREIGPRVGMFYEIIQKKMNGRDIYVKGTITKVNEEEITMKRNIRYSGQYDGLDMPIEKGDYAITHIYPMKWYIIHEYFSKDGKLKGKYININTPTEVFPKFTRYIDLEVDIVEKDDKRKMIDIDKLDEVKKDGKISSEFYNFIMQKSNSILMGGDNFDRRKS